VRLEFFQYDAAKECGMSLTPGTRARHMARGDSFAPSKSNNDFMRESFSQVLDLNINLLVTDVENLIV
jgi:hypothetical protein